MSNDKFHKRSGTTDQGKDYENLLVAYYSLKLVLNDEVADFKISSNDEEYGNFDDLVIQTKWKNGRSEQFNIQAKHKQTNKNKNLLLEALRADKGKFSVKKRFEEYIEKPDTHNAKFILFTNRKFDIRDNTELIREQHFVIYIAHLKEHFEIVNTANEKQQSVYKFYVRENKDAKDKKTLQEIKKYKDFLRRFYLYTNQKGVNDIRDVIAMSFQDNFKGDVNNVKNYLDFVTTWSNRDGKKDRLNKEFIQLKLAECLLSPHIVIPIVTNNSEKSLLFKNAIDRFDVTLINSSDLGKRIHRMDLIDEINLSELNEAGMKYQILPKYIKNLSEMSDAQKATLSWLCNKGPLILKVDNKNETLIYKAISLCQLSEKKKNFVLVGTKHRSIDGSVFHNLSDLYENCREVYDKIVATFTCTFQGQGEATLEEIIDSNETIRSVFTTDELITMLEGTYNFGGTREMVPDCYIERKLTKVVIDPRFLNRFSDTNVTVISCNGKLGYLKSEFQDVNFLQLDESSDSSDSPQDSLTEFFNKQNIYVAETKCLPEMFKRICEEHPTSPCHHLQLDNNNNLEWLESSKNIENLQQSLSRVNHFVKEKNSLNMYQTNIICADAGMGKSMMMSNIKNNYSSTVWVVKILLREHVSFFENSTDHAQFLNYLLVISPLTQFGQQIFDKYREAGKLVLIWDGIDEIGKEAFENVVKVIEAIAMQGITQWVTARSNLKRVLEEKLNSLSRTIKPFDKKDQQNYVLKRLNDAADLEQTTEEIMNKVDDEHLGVPLHIFMLTELYKNNNQLCKNLLSDTFSVTDLYEYFVNEKFDFYYNKASIDANNNVAKTIIQEHKEQRLEDYQLVALNICLPQRILDTLKLNSIAKFLSKIQKEGDCFGILELTNNTPNFAHRTQAEYFVALWLSNNYTKVRNLETFFFEEYFKGVRLMFDLIMSKECPAHIAVLYKNIDLLQKHRDKVNLLDRVGRTPLHLAASWGETHALLKSQCERKKIVIGTDKGFATKEESPNYTKMLDMLAEKCKTTQKDELFQFDCIQYADRSLSLSAINSLSKFGQTDLQQLENFKDLATVLYYVVKFDYNNLLLDMKDIPFIETNTGGSLLHLCAAFNRPHILLILLQSKLYKSAINKTDQRNWAPVHYASCFGHLNMMTTLKEMSADIHLGSKNGQDTPLYVAVQYGQLEVMRFLLINNSNVNISKNNGWTPLLIAAQRSNLPAVKLLVQHNADVNLSNKERYTPLYVAARKGNLEIVKYLFSKGAKVNEVGKNGETPLYIAAKLGYLNVVQFLINKQSFVNVAKTNGWTPLMIAIKSGHFQIAKLLLENKAMCNNSSTVVSILNSMIWKTKTYEPLDIAAEKGSVEIAELLLKKGAKLSTDDNGNPLYQAVYSGHVDMAELLIKHGAKVKPGLVHAAKLKKQATMMKLLVDSMKQDDSADLVSYEEDNQLEDEQSRMKAFFGGKVGTPSTSSKGRKRCVIIMLILIVVVVFCASSVLNSIIIGK